jgi:hypothetical protein
VSATESQRAYKPHAIGHNIECRLAEDSALRERRAVGNTWTTKLASREI